MLSARWHTRPLAEPGPAWGKEEVWWGEGRPWQAQGQPRETCPAEVILRQRVWSRPKVSARARPQPFLRANPSHLAVFGRRLDSLHVSFVNFQTNLYVDSCKSGANELKRRVGSWAARAHVFRDCEDCGRFVITHAATRHPSHTLSWISTFAAESRRQARSAAKESSYSSARSLQLLLASTSIQESSTESNPQYFAP